MKKLINIAFVYLGAALVSGVFYREFTKFSQFTGKTSLAVTHVHLFMLGVMLFLVLALFSAVTTLPQQKQFGRFLVLYNVSLPFMVSMFYVRGILQVLGTPLSKGVSAAISGVAGLAHIGVGVSLVLLFLALRSCERSSGNS